MWEGLRSDIVQVINFNYDTTFDRSFERGEVPKIAHPHGSLDWTSVGRWNRRAAGGGGWESWRSEREPTAFDQLGYQADGPDAFTQRHPTIVPPASFKEEVIGNSAGPGLGEALRSEWITMSEAVQNARHWILVGLSLVSGDEHLVYLLRRLFSGQTICCSVYDPPSNPSVQETLSRLAEITHYGGRLCLHRLSPKGTILEFLERKDCLRVGKIS